MKKTRIEIYGVIEPHGDNSAASFKSRLNAAAESKAKSIELHVHSPGGDVFEGYAIYNAIKASAVPVDVYIDGIAASMASIIMLAGRKVYMAENAFVMIHAPHTFSCGNAEDLEKSAKLLRDIETLFIEAFAKRTGKTEDDVKAWLVGDNWFNAKDALAEKLVDGIVGKSDIGTAEEEILKKTTANSLLQRFEAITNTIYQSSKTNQEMDKQQLIDRFGLTGVTAQSSDEEVQAAIDSKIKAGEQQAENLRKQQIKSCIDKAVAEKKIKEENRATYEAIGEKSGIETLEKVFADIRVMPESITSRINGKGGNPSDRADWDWEKWQQNDPRGLEALQSNDPEAFNKLYNDFINH